MSTLPKLTEADIRGWLGDLSLDKGRPYYRQGAVFDLRRQGQTLKAMCQGSMSEPYRVQIELGTTGIVEADCSCPVGGGGRCKHVAALLLAWVHQPTQFEDAPDPDARLKEYTQPGLIKLIKRMLDRYPDLEEYLERQPPASQKERAVKPASIRRQVEAAFRSAGDEWSAQYEVERDLMDLVKTGDEYAARQDWSTALIVYEVVARETLERYGEIHDEGEILGVVMECVRGLGDCLDQAKDPGQREIILEALFDIYKWDRTYGGVGVSDEVPDIILAQATADERRAVAAWIREVLPDDTSSVYSYRREAYGGFLLHLEGDDIDDETYLRICRETGRHRDLVTRLLERRRVAEAVAEARATSDYTLLALADIFVAHDQAERGERLIRERLPKTQDSRLPEWLLKRVEGRGDTAEALSLALGLFWQRPSMEGYRRVQTLAQAEKRWDELRGDMLRQLAEKNQYALLTDIHLAEKNVTAALETVEKIQTGWWGAPTGDYRIRVAQAAEAEQPEAALRIYLTAINKLIELHGRENYIQAAAYLERVRALYRHLGQDRIWQELIARLRQENKQLRALREELDKARL